MLDITLCGSIELSRAKEALPEGFLDTLSRKLAD